ncbi:MAG: tRNA pseudouridine(55) synthase TruB [Clostridia bacterium]|nr:tRNA pseudouridine(55) synthase TruB [Clostridia bacterium]
MTGIVNINKPQGRSSHFAVAVIRRITGIKKVGHTGTLDPLATGVLPICIGREATKLSQMIMDGNKGYRATVQLGAETNTQDSEGEVLEQKPFDHVTKEAVLTVLKSFLGEQEQIPPMYSAIKINGQKLYNLARKGIEVERKPRKICIFNIELLHMDLEKGQLELQVDCSKGTYIRTLCSDIGKALGTFAHMTALERNKCGRFTLDSAVTLEKFEELYKQNALEGVLIAPETVLEEIQHENNTVAE